MVCCPEVHDLSELISQHANWVCKKLHVKHGSGGELYYCRLVVFAPHEVLVRRNWVSRLHGCSVMSKMLR